jgi:hypothetical protein
MVVRIPDPDRFISLPEVPVRGIVIDIVLMHLSTGTCIASYQLFADRVEGRDLYLEFNFEHGLPHLLSVLMRT